MHTSSHGGQQAHVLIAEAREAIGTGNVEALQRYASEGTKEDLVSFWTRSIAINDSMTATTIVKLISAMLIRCDGEPGWSAIGAACIRRVLSDHGKAIFRNISSGKALYINPTLRLLITMTTFDVGSLAGEVYAALDFSTFKGWPKLLHPAGPPRKEQKVSLGKRKREENTNSKDAIRGLFIQLLFALLQNVQPSVKAELLSHRQFTTELFKHIGQDDANTLTKMLKGMTSVVETHDIPRTAKVKFFNEWSLERLSLLYAKDITVDEDEDAEEAKAQIRKMLHEFFVRATTVANEGICFAAHGLHPPPAFPKVKLYNPILGAFCLILKPLTDDLQHELLFKMLASTPELVAHYLNHCTLDLDPQLEVSWIKSMGIIEAILALPLPDDQDPTSSLSPVPSKTLADNMLPLNLSKVLVKGIQHSSDLVKLMTAKTFWSAMKKLISSQAAGLVDDDALELIQSRCPDLQIVLKLSMQSVTSDTSEEVTLLREVCILLLNGYVTLFDDLASFDFTSLFSLIVSRPDGSLATAQEQDSVIGMVSHIRGLSWLQRKKDTDSVFMTLLKAVLASSETVHTNRRAAGLRALEDLIREDTFMFSETVASKSEALVWSLRTFSSEEQTVIVKFIEECFIRFQATPYRYRSDASTLASQSSILRVFHEQLEFQPGDLARRWLVSFSNLLVNLGDDDLLHRELIGEDPVVLHDCQEVSLWNAFWLVRFLAMSDAPHQTDKFALLQGIFNKIEEEEASVLKVWLMKQWQILMADRTMFEKGLQTQLLSYFEIVAKNFDQRDLQIPGLSDVIQETVFWTNVPVDLTSLVPAPVAYAWFNDFHEKGMFAYRLLLRLDKAHQIPGRQISHALCELINRADNSCIQPLGLVATAIQQGHVAFEIDFVLEDTTPIDEQQNQPEAAVGLACATLLAQLIKAVPSVTLQVTEYVKTQEAKHILPLLDTMLQLEESRSAALSILEQQQDYFCKTDLSSDAEGSCLLALLDHAPTVRKHFASRLSGIDAISPLTLQIVTALQKHEDSVNEIQAKAYFQAIFQHLTRAFAEDRIEEDRFLSQDTLALIDTLADSIALLGADLVIRWVSGSLTAPLTEAALANQIQHPQIIRLLKTLAQASTEAFPYAKCAQTILAHETALLGEHTKEPLAGLLLRMLTVSPSCASIAWLDELLKLHTGLLDSFNQIVFSILQKLEQALHVSIGSRIKHWHFEEIRPNHAIPASGRSKNVEVVLNKQIALDTLMHFDVCLGTAREVVPVYNLRYMVPLVAGFLYADESMEQLRLLLEHHALGLVFLGLSHLDNDVRTQAASTLALFAKAIGNSKLREKLQLETLLSVLKSSTTASLISSTGKPVPLLTTVFLAFAVPVLTMSSGMHLYEQMNRFLLSRPTLDLLDVPMLMTLFYSSGASVTGTGDYGKEIVWLLRLLVAGFADESLLIAEADDEILPDADEKEQEDDDPEEGEKAKDNSNKHPSLFLEPYKRRHVIPLVLGLYTSRTTTLLVKQLVLDLVGRLVDCASYAKAHDKRGGALRLLKRYGIEVWLSMQKALLLAEERSLELAKSKRARQGASVARRRQEAQTLLQRIEILQGHLKQVI